jgi:HlyD family secretion protein
MGNREKKLAAVTAAALASVILLGCAAKTPGASGPQGTRRIAAISVPTVTLQSGPLIAEHNVAGTVQPVTQSQVASQVGGVVSRVLRKVGDWVTEGVPVVELDATQLRFASRNAQASLQNAQINLAVGQDTSTQANPKLTMQLQSAESALQAAEKNYDSQKALFDLGGVSASQVDSAKSQVQQAQASVEAAKTALDQNQKAETQNIAQMRLSVDQAQIAVDQAAFNLQNAVIKAPFDGQIASIAVSPGMYVNPNSVVFLLVSAERQVAFCISPSDAPNVAAGSVVVFTNQGKKFELRVGQPPSAPVNGVVPMIASAPGSLSLSFGSVGTVTYSLVLAQSLLVPVSAIQTNENQNYIFAVENGKATVKPLTIVAETGTVMAVTGVEPGTQAIINPPPGLLEGSAVVPVAGAGAPGDQGGQGAQQGGGQNGAQVGTGGSQHGGAQGSTHRGQAPNGAAAGQGKTP